MGLLQLNYTDSHHMPLEVELTEEEWRLLSLLVPGVNVCMSLEYIETNYPIFATYKTFSFYVNGLFSTAAACVGIVGSTLLYTQAKRLPLSRRLRVSSLRLFVSLKKYNIDRETSRHVI